MTTHSRTDGSRQPTDTPLLARAWLSVVVVTGSVVLWGADAARAEHANIGLKIIAPDKEVSAVSDRSPPEAGLIKRPVLVVKAGTPLVFQFFLTNTYPHGVLKKVVVRYYIVPIEKSGQMLVPKLRRPPKPTDGTTSKKPSPPGYLVDDSDVVTQGQVTMNFKPRCKVGVRMPFRIKRPGVYLVRVESLNTQSDHEHFSAIDLKVE